MGVTIGNSWLRNNPDLVCPEGHELMSTEQLKFAISNKEELDEEWTEMINERILTAWGYYEDRESV